MTNHPHFCNCSDTSCKFHPSNHTQGCDPCIQKNLRNGEIPSCFFHAVSENLDDLQEFTYESFAKQVLKKNL